MAYGPAYPPSRHSKQSSRLRPPGRLANPPSEMRRRGSRRVTAARCVTNLRGMLGALSLLALLIAFVVPAHAEEPTTRGSILMLPVRSHWVSAPLAEAVAQSLPDALLKAGFSVTVMMPGSPAYRLGVSEGWLNPEDLAGDRVQIVRHNLAVRTGCEASLTAEVGERESETILRGELAGGVSHRQASLEVSAPVGTGNAGGASREGVARKLAQELAAKLAPEVWAQAGADDAGRRDGAPARYDSGQAAMAAGRHQDAALEFAAALAGQPDNPDYISAAADAAVARGRPGEAVPLLRRLSELRPDDKEALLRIGDAALASGEPDQAEAAFRRILDSDPRDLRGLEGAARTARVQGDRSRSETYYRELLSLLGIYRPRPEASEAGGAAALNESLPGILASSRDDGVRLTSMQPSDVGLPIARAYLAAGRCAEGVEALLGYQTPDRPAYSDVDYLPIAADLDKGSEAIARRVATIAEMPVRELTGDALNAELESLHDQSDRLATLAERMQASPKLDPAHRYRVLAYNLLNQSDFEALMYFQTHDSDRKRRADLLRDAFRKARAQAQDLGADLTRFSQTGAREAGPAERG